MATAVSICSNALLLLGAQPINSLTDESDRARLCSALWEQTRDQVLRSHFWNCAKKRATISPDVDTPAYDYSYQFSLPSDWIRTIACGEYGYEVDYRHEGRKILCDESALKLSYVYKNTDVSTWDTALIQAMTYAMKVALAYPITQSAAMVQTAQQEMTFFMKQARAVDGQDEPPETMGDFPLLAARYGAW
jgi:hypothetical protein